MRTNSEFTSEIKMRLRVLMKTKLFFSRPLITFTSKNVWGADTEIHSTVLTIQNNKTTEGNKETEIKDPSSIFMDVEPCLFKKIKSPRLPNFIAKDHFMVTGLTVEPSSDFVPPQLPADAILQNL